MKFIEDKLFEKIDFSEERIEKAEYNYCSFVDCDLSGLDLSNFNFIECTFDTCNLSNVKTGYTAMQDVKFANCKLMGIHFSDCNEFLLSLEFNECDLSFSSFHKLKLKKTNFNNCNLQDVDFVETELSAAQFNNCQLNGAVFENTILTAADFRTANNYTINPETNHIEKAKFSKLGLSGLLDKYNIVVE